MKIEQMQWTQATGWNPEIPGKLAADANLVLVFGSNEHLKNKRHITDIRKAYPNALISGCSTAGEIFDITVSDNSLSVTAIHFEHTQLHTTHARINNPEDSVCCGKKLAQTLPHEGLRYVFVLSDGLNINSSELITGLSGQLPSGITITGGLSGDAGRFEETLVLWQDKAQSHMATLIGLYGKAVNIGFSSLENWASFEPEHPVTRISSNTHDEMDGKSALELYKSHLGRHTAYLPATNIRPSSNLHSANNETNSAKTTLNEPTAELAILISSIKRKRALRKKTGKEVESIREMLGPRPTLTGFYSYGEISPFSLSAKCELHNQTMTITIISET